jgi:hypothetical protein
MIVDTKKSSGLDEISILEGVPVAKKRELELRSIHIHPQK